MTPAQLELLHEAKQLSDQDRLELKRAILARLPTADLFERTETLMPGMYQTRDGWIAVNRTVH